MMRSIKPKKEKIKMNQLQQRWKIKHKIINKNKMKFKQKKERKVNEDSLMLTNRSLLKKCN